MLVSVSQSRPSFKTGIKVTFPKAHGLHNWKDWWGEIPETQFGCFWEGGGWVEYNVQHHHYATQEPGKNSVLLSVSPVHIPPGDTFC